MAIEYLSGKRKISVVSMINSLQLVIYICQNVCQGHSLGAMMAEMTSTSVDKTVSQRDHEKVKKWLKNEHEWSRYVKEYMLAVNTTAM